MAGTDRMTLGHKRDRIMLGDAKTLTGTKLCAGFGKSLAQRIAGERQGAGPTEGGHDSSTTELLRRYTRARGASVEDEP
jgi:hypothetical protein